MPNVLQADTPASKIAAACDPPISSATRQLSASRLLTLLGSVLKPHSRKRKAPAADNKAGVAEPAAKAPDKKRKKDKAGAHEAIAASVLAKPSAENADTTADLDGSSILLHVLSVLQRAADIGDQVCSLGFICAYLPGCCCKDQSSLSYVCAHLLQACII